MHDTILDYDEDDEQKPELGGNRQKAFRFFLYGFGIACVLFYQSTQLGVGHWDGTQMYTTFLVGISCIWFFNGLGLYYTIVAFIKKEPPHWTIFVALAGNTGFFLMACVALGQFFLNKFGLWS